MITVVTPGARTLLQDTGRTGYEHLGVPTSGAADGSSRALANLLTGNPVNAAVFEVAFHGPTLLFQVDTLVAYTGAETDLFLDGARVPTRHTVPVAAGQTLTIGTLREGVYGYLAVAGGIDTPPVLGSRSSCTLSGLGPARLAAGDTFPVGCPTQPPAYRASRTEANTLTSPVRFVAGPHAAMFEAQSRSRFVSSPWEIAVDSSRVGVRLAGSSLPAPTGSLPSLGMVTGAIQVPPTGSPIVLGPDHGTVGGYPVLGVVLPDDLASLFQRPPGYPVRFVEVSLESTEVPAHLTSGAGSHPLLHLDHISA